MTSQPGKDKDIQDAKTDKVAELDEIEVWMDPCDIRYVKKIVIAWCGVPREVNRLMA